MCIFLLVATLGAGLVSVTASPPPPPPADQVPLRVDTDPLAVDVAAGGDHTCVLLQSARVSCYGATASGQSAPFTSANVTQVAAGDGHTCFLLAEGNVVCQGSDVYGELGSHAEGLAVQVATGSDHTCVLLVNGSADCFGRDNWGQSADYVGQNGVQVAAGRSHTCVLRVDQTVWCYGWNYFGQANAYLLEDAVKVTAGYDHSCVLRDNGGIACWGANRYGQSQPSLSSRAVDVSAGAHHTCAVTEQGNVACWGRNHRGQADDYVGGDAVSVSAGAAHTCARLTSQMVHCWGGNADGQAIGYPFDVPPVADADWERRPVWARSVTLTGGERLDQEVHVDVVQVDGGPRGSADTYYDVRVRVADAFTQSYGTYTAGLVREPVHASVLHVESTGTPLEGLQVTVAAFADYDPAEARCLFFTGARCWVWSPVALEQPTWVWEDAEDRALWLGVRVTDPAGNVLASEVVPAPVLGQLTGPHVTRGP